MTTPGGTLDLVSVAVHVATELEGAAPAALSVSELAAGYRHQNPGDVSRVKSALGNDLAGDAAVSAWLVEQTLALLERRGKSGALQLFRDGDRWRFVDGITYDQLTFQGRKLGRKQADPHLRLRDPFNQMSGNFSDNIRSNGDLTELRESMAEHGWVDDPIFNWIADENGCVLVGHRRLAVAAELGIDPAPHKRVVRCGTGDSGDIERFKLAVVSNIGQRPMTKTERQKIVQVLAGPGHDWTQMSIAKALGVSQYTISQDVAALREDGNLLVTNKNNRAEKRGRPPGSTKPKPQEKKTDPELLAEIERRLDAGQPVTPLTKELGISETTLKTAKAHVQGMRVGREQALAELAVEPPPQCVCPNCGHTF